MPSGAPLLFKPVCGGLTSALTARIVTSIPPIARSCSSNSPQLVVIQVPCRFAHCRGERDCWLFHARSVTMWAREGEGRGIPILGLARQFMHQPLLRGRTKPAV